MSIFLDVNVPMYTVGVAHRLKGPCIKVLSLAQAAPASFVTDSEVFQEIVHRYTSIRQWPLGRVVFSEFAMLMAGRIAPVLFTDVQRAAALADVHTDVDARDLLHAAIMSRLGVTQICSTDQAFDRIDGIERLDPERVEDWTATISG